MEYQTSYNSYCKGYPKHKTSIKNSGKEGHKEKEKEINDQTYEFTGFA